MVIILPNILETWSKVLHLPSPSQSPQLHQCLGQHHCSLELSWNVFCTLRWTFSHAAGDSSLPAQRNLPPVSSQLCKTSSNKLFQLVLQGTKHRHIPQNRWLECFKLHLPAISLLSSHNQRQPGHSCHPSARALRIKATPGKPAGALTAHFQTAATEKSQECLSSGNGGSTSLPTTLCTDLQCDSKQNALSFWFHISHIFYCWFGGMVDSSDVLLEQFKMQLAHISTERLTEIQMWSNSQSSQNISEFCYFLTSATLVPLYFCSFALTTDPSIRRALGNMLAVFQDLFLLQQNPLVFLIANYKQILW